MDCLRRTGENDAGGDFLRRRERDLRRGGLQTGPRQAAGRVCVDFTAGELFKRNPDGDEQRRRLSRR